VINQRVINNFFFNIKINSIVVKDDIWEGDYIEDNPIQIEAIAKEGYVFERWKSRRLPENAKIVVNTKKNEKFAPIYRKL
jgi:hypothetical protein